MHCSFVIGRLIPFAITWLNQGIQTLPLSFPGLTGESKHSHCHSPA